MRTSRQNLAVRIQRLEIETKGLELYLAEEMAKRRPGWRWRTTCRSPPGQNSMRRHDVQGGEEGVVKCVEDLLLGLRTLELLAESERLPVDHLHGVEAAREAGVAETAKIDVAEVAAPEATHEAEVLEVDAAGGGTETLDGLPLGLVRLVRLQLLLLASAAAGAGGDGSAEADVANPAPAGFEGSAKGRAAAVVVGVVSAGGDRHGLAFDIDDVGKDSAHPSYPLP
ncbi:hypothetical protein MUK42_25747 [Musa troglodytarum]|uniref:Uncharacterized protein n=1 Tax=Musa troglodytarum TaxID=320322 RepID=A0A9E7I712_9LILI|nr:hypothetical protein MUK42_25747 [Musa troglodytarum]